MQVCSSIAVLISFDFPIYSMIEMLSWTEEIFGATENSQWIHQYRCEFNHTFNMSGSVGQYFPFDQHEHALT